MSFYYYDITQVMAFSVILILSDSSKESVGTSTARVILFGMIPTIVPTNAPTADLPVIHDDTPLIPTNTPTVSPIVPIVPTIPSIAPIIQYTSSFVCTDSSDSDTPDTPPSPSILQILPALPRLPRRPAVLVLPGQPIPIADYSSPDHFTLDDSSRDSLSNSLSDSPCDSPSASSVGPSHKRRRSPTTSVPIASPVRGALSPVCADLSPPRKRIKHSDSETDFEVSSEEGYVSYVSREIVLGVDVEDSYEPYTEPNIDPDVQANIDASITFADDIATRGTDVRVRIGTAVKEEAESSARGMIEIRVD
ncbi:hypothetical protein Tco_0086571 [Tanacetum coccineum]